MELDVEFEARQVFQTALNEYVQEVKGTVAERDIDVVQMLQKWGKHFDYGSYLALNYSGLDKRIANTVQVLKSSACDSGTMQTIYTLCACITRIKGSATHSLGYAPFNEAEFIGLPMSVSAFFGTAYNSFYAENLAQCLPEYILNVTKQHTSKTEAIYEKILTEKGEFEKKISNEFDKFNKSVESLNQLYENVDKAHAEGTFSLLSAGFGRQMKPLKYAKYFLLILTALFACAIVTIPSCKLHSMGSQQALESGTARPSVNSTQVLQGSNSTEVVVTDQFPKISDGDWRLIAPDRLSALRTLLMFSIEIILIYFFRICLMHYNRIANQIAQYDARIALCGFAPEYAKFIEGKSAEVKESFKHFEEHVMSKVDQTNVVIPTALECTIPVKIPKTDSK